MSRIRWLAAAMVCLAPISASLAEDAPDTLDPGAIASGLLGQPLPEGTRGFTVAERSNSVAINIRFELNSAKLKPEAAPQLDSLWEALTLAQLRGKQVEISGHTDSSGPDDYNLKLSEQRAHSVRDYLLAKGRLKAERIGAMGRGELQPLRDKRPEDPVNRRVEIRLVPRVSE